MLMITHSFMPWPVSGAEMEIRESGYRTCCHVVPFFEELLIKLEDETHIFIKTGNDWKVALGRENQWTQ